MLSVIQFCLKEDWKAQVKEVESIFEDMVGASELMIDNEEVPEEFIVYHLSLIDGMEILNETVETLSPSLSHNKLVAINLTIEEVGENIRTAMEDIENKIND